MKGRPHDFSERPTLSIAVSGLASTPTVLFRRNASFVERPQRHRHFAHPWLTWAPPSKALSLFAFVEIVFLRPRFGLRPWIHRGQV